MFRYFYESGIFLQEICVYHKNYAILLELGIFRYFLQNWPIYPKKRLFVTKITL